MVQYMYALSIVSRDGERINNGLYSGLAERSAMIRTIRDIQNVYDSNFTRNVAIIACNLAEFQGSGKSFQLRRSYASGTLSDCLEDIIGDIENILS